MLANLEIPREPHPNRKRISIIHAVVRANFSYQSQASGELSFEKGQEFTVIPGSAGKDYYEVIHPNTRERGLVPTKMVDYYPPNSPTNIAKPTVLETMKINQPEKSIIGFALASTKSPINGYLEINKDDPVLVVDEGPDYYIAKPIGKLGIPGKIPKTQVRLQEVPPVSNQNSKASSSSSKGSSTPNYRYTLPSIPDNTMRSRKSSSIMGSLSGSKPKLGSSRRMDGGRGSVTSRSFYSSSIDFFSGEVDFEKLGPSTSPVFDIFALKVYPVDDIDYIQLGVKYQDSTYHTVFRRQDDFALLLEQLNHKFKDKLFPKTQHHLPTLPQLRINNIDPKAKYALSSTDLYLTDVEAFFADLIYLMDYIPLMSLLSVVFIEREIDVMLHKAIELNIPIISRRGSRDLSYNLPSPELMTPIQLPHLLESDSEDNRESTPPSTPLPPRLDPAECLKIKLQIESNLYAFYLPSTQPDYLMFLEKVIERVGQHPKEMQYRDNDTNQLLPISNSDQFQDILKISKNRFYVIISV